MPVSKEELIKDLETPEYQAVVKETLAKREFVVQDKTEHASYLDRFKTDVIEKEMPTRVKSVHDQYDKDIKELYGVDREPTEKTYDYLKRAAKTKLGELQSSSDKIKELEEAIRKGDSSGALQRRLEEEEARYKKTLGERDQTIESLKKQGEVTSKTADVKLLYGEIKKGFVKQLPPMFARAEAAALDEAIRNSVARDGKLYMSNSDGSIKKDASFNEVTVEAFLKQEFKDVIETQKKQGGGGSQGGGGDPPTDPTKYTPETFPMREELKTKAALMDYMLSLGIKQGTPVFQNIWKKYGLPMEA